MKSNLLIFVLFLASSLTVFGQTIPYGNNKAVGKYVRINGVNLYYEEYGAGEPLLLIHGNGTGIKGHRPQIDYFSKKYKVIAVDCRGRGKSEMGRDSLTYIGMADDMAKFIEKMNLDSVNVLGRSDGGIVALLMGIYYPQHLKKIIAFGANMWPDSTALFPESVADVTRERIRAEEMLAKKDTTKNWYVERQRYRLMEFQPHITGAELGRIKVPVLVMSCDRDVIREEHTLFIYKHIPNANLSIFPGEVHKVSTFNPELFNSTVDRFLSRPFKDNSIRFK